LIHKIFLIKVKAIVIFFYSLTTNDLSTHITILQIKINLKLLGIFSIIFVILIANKRKNFPPKNLLKSAKFLYNHGRRNQPKNAETNSVA